MPLTAFTHFRFLWGAVDFQAGTDHPYGLTETANLGTSAAPGGGVGVRRVVLTIDRATDHAGADPAQCHFDFLNITAGAPDDTWTSGDYSTLEGYLDTWFTALRGYIGPGHKLTQYTWYRVGVGVHAPNPAERTTVKATPITGSAASMVLPPQAACSITFRTALRKHWGRTYFPFNGATMQAGGTPSNAQVDGIATATQTLVTSAATAEFYLVVVCPSLSAALNVEHLEVDNNIDVIRRRRWKAATYKKILP